MTKRGRSSAYQTAQLRRCSEVGEEERARRVGDGASGKENGGWGYLFDVESAGKLSIQLAARLAAQAEARATSSVEVILQSSTRTSSSASGKTAAGIEMCSANIQTGNVLKKSCKYLSRA